MWTAINTYEYDDDDDDNSFYELCQNIGTLHNIKIIFCILHLY
jgi:hypothetical protein